MGSERSREPGGLVNPSVDAAQLQGAGSAIASFQSKCPEGWCVIPLTDAVSFQEGPGILAKDFRDEGVPLLRLKCIEGDYVRLDGCNFLAPEMVAKKWDHFRVHDGDLLISTSATLGRVSVVTPESAGGIPYTGLIRFRPKDTRLDISYLKAFLSSAAFVSQAESMATGSVIRHFGPSHIRQMALFLPPISEQIEIGAINSILDERLRAIRETNATLEAIVQTLFKSWFVDFDPVRAKAEGREPDGLDATTAALFPSTFEDDTAIAATPTGWSSSALYDLAQFINGAAYKAFEPNAERRGLPIIKIAELKAGVTSQTAFSEVDMPLKYRIDSNDILFSWSGNPDTSIDTFVWSHGAAWLNQHIFRVVPHDPHERSFVLLTLKYLKSTFAEIARDKQTTGLGHVTVADLKRLRVVKPDMPLLKEWNKLVDPLIERAFLTQQQAQSLAQLRDTLLPRLISGKLRLPEAQTLIAEATP